MRNLFLIFIVSARVLGTQSLAQERGLFKQSNRDKQSFDHDKYTRSLGPNTDNLVKTRQLKLKSQGQRARRTEIISSIKDVLSDVGNGYMDVANFVPQTLGAQYNDKTDKVISAVGSTALGYGAYNLLARRNSFKLLKSKLRRNLQSRELLFQKQQEQTNMIDTAIESLNSNLKMLNSYQNSLLDNFDNEIVSQRKHTF